MEWKTKRNVKMVLREIGKVTGEYRKHKGKKVLIGDITDFNLRLWNGVNNGTPTAELWAGKIFGSMANTIGQGVREIIAKMYGEMGCYPKHECSVCHRVHGDYDLSELQVDAIEELMQEIAEIATAMNPGKTWATTGRNCGPIFLLEIDFMLGSAKLYLSEVQERFAVKERILNSLQFKSKRGLYTIEAIEDVLEQARKHLEAHKPHTCSICGRICG